MSFAGVCVCCGGVDGGEGVVCAEDADGAGSVNMGRGTRGCVGVRGRLGVRGRVGVLRRSTAGAPWPFAVCWCASVLGSLLSPRLVPGLPARLPRSRSNTGSKTAEALGEPAELTEVSVCEAETERVNQLAPLVAECWVLPLVVRGAAAAVGERCAWVLRFAGDEEGDGEGDAERELGKRLLPADLRRDFSFSLR